MKRDSNWWHNWFFGLAEHVASASKDPSTKVGAVIVDSWNRTILGVGYNGFPRYVEDTYTTREDKLLRTVHAEANAILNATRPVSNATIYVTPLHPCANCAGLIIQSGIKMVHYRMGPRATAWREHFDVMAEMFDQAGVRYQEHPNE